jgi:hypothetical protein
MKNLNNPTRKIFIFLIILHFCNNQQINAQNDSIANLPQYLFPEFTNCTIRLKTGVTITAVMNYNTLTEQMTFYQNGTLMDLNKPETVDTIFLQNTKFIFFENMFYEVLVKAPVALFIQHKSDLTSTGNPAAYGTTSQTVGPTSVSKLYSNNNRTYNLKLPENSKVTPSPVYWIRINNVMNSFQTERQFLKNFPTKKDEIKRFIDQSKIKINRMEDLIKLINYCNTLRM